MPLIGFRIKTPEEMNRDLDEWRNNGAPADEEPDTLIVNDYEAHQKFVRRLLDIIGSRQG